MTDAPPLLVVAAALVDGEGRVLVQRRPPGKPMAGLWEYPGGKLEPGEAPGTALVRELAEELAIAVAPADLQPIAFADAPLDNRRLLLLLYGVCRWSGTPRAVTASELRWVAPATLADLPMPPADRPLLIALHRWLAG